METIVYIDGYNLYYGRLRNTAYKWLDIVSLFDSICSIQNPENQLVKVKFFTSPIKAQLASHGEDASRSQNAYHKALLSKYPDIVEVIKGDHCVDPATAPLRSEEPIDRQNTTPIWKIEEKQTDVNIALHMYRDAVVTKQCQQCVLVSNDSDLEPALKMIKQDSPNINCGVIFPRWEPSSVSGKSRKPSMSLINHSDWCRKYILSSELENSLLPDVVPSKRKPARKPLYW